MPELSMPPVTIASLRASDFDKLRHRFPALERQTWDWLHALHRHPATPTHVRREIPLADLEMRTIIDVGVVEATCNPPWWRLVCVRIDDRGEPVPDPKMPGLFLTEAFEPFIPPPAALVLAMDEMSGHRLSKRTDGGPKPPTDTVDGAVSKPTRNWS